MQQVLSFLENANTNAVIIVALLVMCVLLLVPQIPVLSKYFPFFKKVNKISDVQDEKYPAIEKYLKHISEQYEDAKERQEYIIKFQTNHSIHEIPDIVKKLDKLDAKFDIIMEKVSDHGERISRIEGKLSK